MRVTTIPALKIALNYFGVCVYDERMIFLTGGESRQKVRAGVHTLDLHSGIWLRRAYDHFRNARACHVTITMGHKLYIFGGYGPN